MRITDESYNFIENCKLDCLNNGKCIEYQRRNMCLVKNANLKRINTNFINQCSFGFSGDYCQLHSLAFEGLGFNLLPPESINQKSTTFYWAIEGARHVNNELYEI